MLGTESVYATFLTGLVRDSHHPGCHLFWNTFTTPLPKRASICIPTSSLLTQTHHRLYLTLLLVFSSGSVLTGAPATLESTSSCWIHLPTPHAKHMAWNRADCNHMLNLRTENKRKGAQSESPESNAQLQSTLQLHVTIDLATWGQSRGYQGSTAWSLASAEVVQSLTICPMGSSATQIQNLKLSLISK